LHYQKNNNMNKKEQIENFIKKWNVGFESKEQEKEFADEMFLELTALSQPTTDLEWERGITITHVNKTTDLDELKEQWIKRSDYIKNIKGVDTDEIWNFFLPHLQSPVESEWISVEDRLPDEDISYYCYTNVGGYCTCFYKNGNWRYQHNSGLIDTVLNITHYKPQIPPIQTK
jgi:hypothetical protein